MSGRYLLMLFVFLFGGCGSAKDYSLAPDLDGEHVTVIVKVPDELIARGLEVIYRSTFCTFTDYTARGTPYQRDGYQQMDLQPVRQGQTDLYEAKLPVDGGGACRWRLSNVTFGVKYKDTSKFGAEVSYGAGGGVVVIFDNNRSGRGGANKKADGDLVIRQDYYPWLNERFIGGYRKSISLTAEGYIYLMYQAVQARQVYFEPIVHSRYLVRSVGPEVKSKGNRAIFYYPDGSSSPEIQAQPSFRKLQAMRLAVEGEE